MDSVVEGQASVALEQSGAVWLPDWRVALRGLPLGSMLLALLAWIVAATPTLADELSDEEASEVAKQVLGGRSRYPFYDRAKDDVRQLNVLPASHNDSANRQSDWEGEAATPRQRTPNPVTWGGSPLGVLLQVLGLTVLVLLLLLLAWFIARTFLKGELTETKVSKVVETSREVDRVEKLPFQLRKAAGDFLAEARRLYEAGHYSEAIIYLYSHQLVELDKHHLIRLAKGKTNRQYSREARARPLLKETLDQTMFAFEDVFFGHHELSRPQFEACWQRLDEFHQELEKLERAAA
jgi:HEPN domain-containing protein